MDKNKCTRIWKSESGMSWMCHPRACVFCDHCTDIWYDHLGPYLITCEKLLSTTTGCRGLCNSFVEENPVYITEEDIKNDIKIAEEARKFLSSYPEIFKKIELEIEKAISENIDNFTEFKNYTVGDRASFEKLLIERVRETDINNGFLSNKHKDPT